MSSFWYKIVFIKCGAYPRFTKEQIGIAFPAVFTINIKDLYYIKFAFETNERKGALKLCVHVVVFCFSGSLFYVYKVTKVLLSLSQSLAW